MPLPFSAKKLPHGCQAEIKTVSDSFGILLAFQFLLVGAQFYVVFSAFGHCFLVAALTAVFTMKQTLPYQTNSTVQTILSVKKQLLKTCLTLVLFGPNQGQTMTLKCSQTHLQLQSFLGLIRKQEHLLVLELVCVCIMNKQNKD